MDRLQVYDCDNRFVPPNIKFWMHLGRICLWTLLSACSVHNEDQYGGIFIYGFGILKGGSENDTLRILQKQSNVYQIEMHASFMNYTGGIYKEPKYLIFYWEKMGYHFIEIIGYGYEGRIPYFLGKNTWGEDLGDGWYIKILRNDTYDGVLGINRYVQYPIIGRSFNMEDVIRSDCGMKEKREAQNESEN